VKVALTVFKITTSTHIVQVLESDGNMPYKVLKSRGNTPATKGPGKSWKTNWDVLYEPCDIFLIEFFLVTVSFTMNHLWIILVMEIFQL